LSYYFDVPKSKAPIQDAADLTSLECHKSKISSLRGIDALTKLKSFSISLDKQLTDVSPLARVSTLESINLLNASEEIENLEALQGLPNLKSITFPNLSVSYCYQAEKVVKSMEWNHDKVKHNLKTIRCRGKKTDYVKKLLVKVEDNKELSEKDQQLVEDYEENLRWTD